MMSWPLLIAGIVLATGFVVGFAISVIAFLRIEQGTKFSKALIIAGASSFLLYFFFPELLGLALYPGLFADFW